MFINHPIFGVGWQRFAENALDYGMDKKLIAHNTVISVLAETGLVGIVCLLGIAYYSFRQLLRIRKEWSSDEQRAGLLALTNGVMISFFCSFVSGIFAVVDQDPMYRSVMSLVGILCAIDAREKKEALIG
jgi:O-antigen ligase